MPEVTLVAPQNVVVGDTTYHIVPPPTPVDPPKPTVPVTVVPIGSDVTISTTDGHLMGIATSGVITDHGNKVPGSDGSDAVGYDATTTNIYGRDQGTKVWWQWNKDMTLGCAWFIPTPPWTPTGSLPTPPVVGTDQRARMIQWMADMKAKGKVMLGQYCDSATAGMNDAQAFTNVTGKHVALLGDGLWPFWPYKGNAGTAGRSVAQITTDAIAQWDSGGLPYIQSSFPSPDGSDMYGTCTPSEVIRPGSAQYNKLFSFYDQEINFLLPLKQRGMVLPYRCLFENRWNFWWGFGGNNGWTTQQWITMWQQHHDYLVSKGCDHLIWVLSQYLNPTNDPVNKRDTWPGDKFVDMQGEDVYTDVSGQYKPLKDGETSAHPNHPWWMAEWGSGSPSQGNPSFDMRTLMRDVAPGGQMAGTVAIQAWCGSQGQYAWRLANMQHLAEAMAMDNVLLRENLGRPS